MTKDEAGVGAESEPDGVRVRLNDVGCNEAWLHDQIVDDPAILGLGDIEILAQEVHHGDAGKLDILAAAEDTYYSIEVQLGEVDTSHGFRLIDYWARNRKRDPDMAHVAVLIAESAVGRYRTALEALAEHIPLLVIEIRAYSMADNIVLRPQAVIANASLDVAVIPAAEQMSERTLDDWRDETEPGAWETFEALLGAVEREIGRVWVDYSLRTYVAVRRGRRLWATIRFPKDRAVSTNVPDPDGGRGAYPSGAFEMFAKALASIGVALAWNASYNGGAQSVNVRLRRQDVDHAEVIALLQASWDWFTPGVATISERFGDARETASYYSADTDWRGDFDPYYTVDYPEVGYPGRGYIHLLHWSDRETAEQLWAVADADWESDGGARELARRVIVHHTQERPTKRRIDLFLRGPARDWDIGDHWTLQSGELAAWLHEWR